MNSAQIQKRIAQLQQQMLELGRLHPGSISEQYNVCGTLGCRCKDPKDPQKHGPYYQLSLLGAAKAARAFCGPNRLPIPEKRSPITNGYGS
jgi:Family of unknown function (DUF6788)